MIKTIKLKIKVNPANLKNLRNYLPEVKSGDVIEIPPDYLTKTSHIKVECECDVCGSIKQTPYRQYIVSISNGGYYACSPKCSKQKVVNTNFIKYGVDNPAKSQEIKDKIKNIFQEKYGVDNISFLPEIVDKIKESVNKTYSDNYDEIKSKMLLTNMRRYGVEDPNKEDWLKDKIKKSNIEKYGVDNPSKVDSIINKTMETCKKKYGCSYAIGSEVIKNKIKLTNLDRYGFENVFKSEEIKDKIKETNIKKYGCEYISQNPEVYEKQVLSGFRIKKHECGLTYQGTYEKDFIDFCISKDISISKPPSFLYEMSGDVKRYYPDFFIEDRNLIIEVKSTYYYNLNRDKNEAKRKSIIDNGLSYLLVIDKNYDNLISIIKT